MLGLGSAETNIKAVITADDKASSVLKGFGDHVGGMGKAIEKGLKAAAVGIAAGTAAAIGFGVLSVKAFSESQDAIAQTNAVLKSTKNIAGITADEVTKLATALQKSTKYSDEEVRSAENLLLTFTSIGKDIFPQVTETVLDMSTALGQDLKSSSVQLGKALQDPILGVTALRRVGVNFSEAQQDVIKSLVETGQKAEAQKLILSELRTEFGGSAEAAGNTFAGSLAKLKNSFNDIQESIGQFIVEAITPLVTRLADVIKAIDWQAVIQRTSDAVRNFWQNTILPFSRSVAEIATTVYNFLEPSLKALWNTIETELAPALSKVWNEVLKPLAPFIGAVLVGALWVLINVLNFWIDVWSKVISVMSTVIGWILKFIGAIVDAAKWVGNAVSSIINFFSSLPDKIGGAVSGVYDRLTSPFRSAFDWIIQQVERVKKAIGSIKDGVSSVINAPGNAVKGVGGFFSGLFDKLPGFAEGGIIPGPIGQPQLVVAHGGETVVPTNQPGQGALDMGSNKQINFVVNVGLYAGSEQEKRKIAMELMRSLQDVASSRSTSVGGLIGI